MSSYEYHQILQFLYFEGYTDSYEEAEELVESLSDDEFEELNEARRKLAHSFPLKPSERRSVENIERMNRGDFSVPPGGSVRVKSSRKAEPEVEPKPEEKKPTGKRRIRTNMSDVIVAHYLFDEGYADSLDGAEVMAENISDNWVNEILDEKYVKEMNPKGDDRRARTTDPTIRPSRLKKMPDVIKQTESGFDKTASRRSPGARRRKDERRQGTGGFGA
jgi:hypothetical protein